MLWLDCGQAERCLQYTYILTVAWKYRHLHYCVPFTISHNIMSSVQQHPCLISTR
jgi:hypothetical protein